MTDPRRVAVLASGRGTDLQSLIDAQAQGRITSRVVVVASDHPEAAALARAQRHGIASLAVPPDPVLKGPARRADQEDRLLEALQPYEPDLVVLAGYMRVLGASFVQAFARRLINIHPTLLPGFPGTHGQRQALAWGVRVAGCTTHFVDEQVDHGPIILQAALAVRPDDTEASLSRRILDVEHQLLPRTVHLWEQDRLSIEGRRVVIDADTSWTERYPTIPGVLYGPGY